MKSYKIKGTKKSYINKINEWQRHQYDPYYYTGGKIPPVITDTGRPKLLGWTIILTNLIVYISIIIAAFDLENIHIMIQIYAVITPITAFCIYIGFRLVKKGSTQQNYLKIKSTILKSVLSLIIIVIFLVLINIFVLEKSNQIVIDDVRNIKITTKDGNNGTEIYIMINNKSLLISFNDLSKFNRGYFLDIKNLVTDKPIRIYYKWNLVFPHSGRVVKVDVLN